MEVIAIKVKIIVLLALIIVSMCSISYLIIAGVKNKNSNSLLNTTSNNINILSKENISSKLKEIINSNLWYKSPDNEIFNFTLNEEVSYEIYYGRSGDGSTEETGIIFLNPINEKNELVGITIPINNDKLESSFDIYMYDSYDELKNIFKDFEFLGSDKITIHAAEKPVYYNNSDKETKVTKIEEVIKEGMDWWLEKGKYTVYVKNFNETDAQTDAIAVNENGEYIQFPVQDINLDSMYMGKYTYITQRDLTDEQFKELVSEFKFYAERIQEVPAITFDYEVK